MSEEVRTDWESYPSGLKVLAVDDDPLCLKVVEQMLRRCNYEVRTAENGREALAKLRDKSLQIDLVLSDVYMPDMDGFKLLETVGLELDLPVIMMSSNGETPVVLRGVTHGAVDFLIKPVRIEELRNVWQHVVRRRKDQAHTSQHSGEDDPMDGSRQEKKRKDVRRDSDEQASAKKPRVVWSVEMHQQFVNAVNSLGIDKAVPKRILDLMNVEGLTRENVASHLQKYRLYLKRVAGVHSQAGRGMPLHGPYPPMMGPSQIVVSPAGGPDLLARDQDQEQLKLQLQMQQPRHQQAATTAQQPLAMPQSQFCKQEPMIMIGGAGPSYDPDSHGASNGLPGSESGHVISPLTTSSRPDAAELAGPSSSLNFVPLQGSGTYAAAAAAPYPALPPQQGYGVGGLEQLTSSDLVYPDSLPPPAELESHDLRHALIRGQPGQPLPTSQHITDPSAPSDRLPNGHTEQDIESFINIFLKQPGD